MRRSFVFPMLLLVPVLALAACAPDGSVPESHVPVGAASGLGGEYLGLAPPGRAPEIFAPGIISHGFHEHHLSISPAGDEMFYATSSSDHQVYVIAHVWKENGVWNGPEIAPFSGRFMDMGPAFSPDGQTLYFTSHRPLAGEQSEEPQTNPAGSPTFDIWKVEKLEAGAGGRWSEPANLGSPVNSEANEIFPSVASDGTLYFQFFEESGNESDFYTSEVVDGDYQQPVKLEYGISTEHYESHPAIAPDESWLIFQSIRPGGYGGVDFYVSFRQDDGTWSEPENLGEIVSAADNVISPMLSPDGKYFFFARNGPSEPFSFRGDSYAELIELLRSPNNGYGCLYWVDAEVVYELHPRLRR